MRDSGLTPAAVALDARQQRFVARLAIAYKCSKSKNLYDYPTRGAPVGRVAVSEYVQGRRTEWMLWPDLGEKPAVKTTILEDDATAKSSVSNGSGPSLRVRVRVQTGPLPNWRSGSSINPNSPLGYGSMVNSQPI